MFKNHTKSVMCNFEVDSNVETNEDFEPVWKGDWSVSEYYVKKVVHAVWSDDLLLKVIDNDEVYKHKVLLFAVKSFLTFISQNWQTHPEPFNLEEYLGFEWKKDIDVLAILQKDSEPICGNIVHPELFYLASEIFQALYLFEPQNFVYTWWLFRSKVTHQRILEDTSASLFYAMDEELIPRLWNHQQMLLTKPRVGALLLTEIGQAYLMYGRVQKAHKFMTKAQAIVGLKLELKGVLGKRTKHQQTALPQLALSCTLDPSKDPPSPEPTTGDSCCWVKFSSPRTPDESSPPHTPGESSPPHTPGESLPIHFDGGSLPTITNGETLPPQPPGESLPPHTSGEPLPTITNGESWRTITNGDSLPPHAPRESWRTITNGETLSPHAPRESWRTITNGETLPSQRPGESLPPHAPRESWRTITNGDSLPPHTPRESWRTITNGETWPPHVPRESWRTITNGETLPPHAPDNSLPSLTNGESLLTHTTGESLPPHAPGESLPPQTPGESLPPHAPGESLPPHAPGESLPPHAPGESLPPHTPGESLPPQVPLDDDVRLDKVQYTEAVPQADLPSLEQTLCLLNVQYLEKAQPRDNLMQEELLPYIEMVLAQKNGPWSARVAALLMRCKLEANHKRTVERAMQQCEAIVNDKNYLAPTDRLSYHWACGLAPSWTWRQQLGSLYLSLGLVKAALEQFLMLQLWEDVIVCYTMLQLRHKAAEIIQTQIDIKPTVKLYCLLGDATDDLSYYEKAWEFSNEKSSRAQRHWGNYLFDRKMYAECIPHFEKSVEINSIQERVWLRLGFAALETEQWELSAKAYRRYVYLQPNSFEAWNNLAKIYTKQGDKQRAYKALMEALKFNYDNWKLWENVIVISLSTNHHDDALAGVHRLLDLRGKFEDLEVLSLLVRGLLECRGRTDEGREMRYRKRLLELFGRITSIHRNNPGIWKLYADLSPSDLLRGQRLLKAYCGYTQNGNWPSNPETCKQVIELAKLLLECSQKAREDAEEKNLAEANNQLSSARLTGQAVIRASEKQNWPECTANLDELKTLFSNVTEYMKSIM